MACNKDNDSDDDGPSQVTFTPAGLYPEGTQHDDDNDRFLVNSQTAGRSGQVKEEGALFKVLLANPGSFTKVVTTGLTLTGDDGLPLTDNNTLLVVCNAQSQVYRLNSTHRFSSVSRTGSFGTGAVSPTTVARRAGQRYVLYPYSNALQQLQNPPVAQCSRTRVAC